MTENQENVPPPAVEEPQVGKTESKPFSAQKDSTNNSAKISKEDSVSVKKESVVPPPVTVPN
jgi:hypothetical protein